MSEANKPGRPAKRVIVSLKGQRIVMLRDSWKQLLVDCILSVTSDPKSKPSTFFTSELLTSEKYGGEIEKASDTINVENLDMKTIVSLIQTL